MHSSKNVHPISPASGVSRERVTITLQRFSGNCVGARNARRIWRRREGLLVDLDVDGVHGIGEASPLPGYSPDTLDDAQTALAAIDRRALGRALALPEINATLKGAAELLPSTQPAARMALETAVLDWCARRHGVSAASLLGIDPQAARALAWLVTAADPVGVRAAEAAGYRHFKMKIGAPGSLAAELIDVVDLTRSLGSQSRLRLDVNQAWTQVQAQSACRALVGTQIEFIEEPCRGWSRPLDTDIPMALDESLRGCHPDELAALVGKTGAGVVVLKPMLLGGITRCLEWGRQASALGLGIVVSHSFDGPVALMAAGAIALALPTACAQGLAPHAGLAAWPRLRLPIVGGALRAWIEPGLGMSRGDWQ
jgi:o-succinylbenzoate synthase